MTKTELTVEQLLALFEDMPIKQMNELVKAMEEKFGVSSQAVVVAGGAGGAGAAAVEEKSEFDVVIKSGGDKKIQVIKVVRDFTSLGLKEAKDLVDAGGKLLEGVSKEKAQEAKAKLEENGAVVEIV